jgi:Rrf2 family protein
MKLSRSVAYALQATILLAELPDGKPVPCSRIAIAGHMPERFLLQILRSLVTHGILESTRGVDGGYWLRRPPSEISLKDLIEAVEGPLEPTTAAGDGLSPGSKRRLTVILEELASTKRQQLEAIKISSLLAPSETHAH